MGPYRFVTVTAWRPASDLPATDVRGRCGLRCRWLDMACWVVIPMAATRAALVLTRPDLRAKALELLLAAQQVFADWLRTAYPKLDDVAAATVSGLIGGLAGAALVSLDCGDPPERIRTELERAVALLGRGLAAAEGWPAPTASRPSPQDDGRRRLLNHRPPQPTGHEPEPPTD